MNGCPSTDLLEQYALGRLTGRQATSLGNHLESCAACADRLRAVVGDIAFADEVRAVARRHPSAIAGATAGVDAACDLDAACPTIPGYRIDRRIRRGGQGTVYEAYQESTRRHVAVKVLDREATARPGARRRFEREVELAARLRHPAIVTVHDSGMHGGHLHIVMDYIAGEHLDAYVRNHAPSAAGKVELFTRIVDAVNHAHRRGIIHRDLKPSNILVDAEGHPHVLDFGLAKLASPAEESIDRTDISLEGQVLGTLAYMSPEHITGRPADIEVRSDIYTLGVLLFQMLTGTFPYDVKGSYTGVFRNIAETPPLQPSKLDRALDTDLETIVLKCLEKDPARRYATADALAQDLRHYRAGEAIDARRDSSWYVLRKTLRRHRVAATVAFASVLVLAIGLVAMTRLRADAQSAQVNAEWQSYLGNLAAADSAIKLHDPVDARTRLAAIAPRQRDWPWHFLQARTDDALAVYAGSRSEAQAITFSPDGTRLATSLADGAITVRNVATGETVCKLNAGGDSCWALAFHPRGDMLISGDTGGHLYAWDLTTGSSQPVSIATNSSIVRVAWNAAGDLLAAGDTSGNVAVISWPSQKPVFSDDRRNAWPIAGLAFVRNDKALAVAGVDRHLRTWNLDTGALADGDDVVIHDDNVADLAVDRSCRRLVSAGLDRAVRLWDADTLVPIDEIIDLPAPPSAVAFSPDGTCVTIGLYNGQLLHWRPGQSPSLVTLQGHSAEIRCVAYSPTGDLVASSSVDGTVRFWPPPGTERDVRRSHADLITALAVSPDGGTLATGSKDCTVALYDMPTGRQYAALDHPFRLAELAFSRDGRRLAAATDEGAIYLWDIVERTVRSVFCTDGSRVVGLAFGRHDDQIICATARSGVYVIGLDGTITQSREVLSPAVTAAIHDHWVVIGNADGGVSIHHLADGKTAATLPLNDCITMGIAFSPDGAHLATTSSDGIIRIWRSGDWTLERYFAGHVGTATELTFNSTGDRLISGGHDNLVRLWDVHTGTPLLALAGHTGMITCLAFIPGTDDFASGSLDMSVRLWRPSPETSLADWLADCSARRALAAARRPAPETAPPFEVDADALERVRTQESLDRATAQRRQAVKLENRAWNKAKSPDLQPSEYAAALRDASDSVALDCNWITLKTRAAALYRTGHYAEALTEFRECFAMHGDCQPHYASDLPLYAMAAWQAGERDEARRILDLVKHLDDLNWQGDESLIAGLIAEAEGLIEAPAVAR